MTVRKECPRTSGTNESLNPLLNFYASPRINDFGSTDSYSIRSPVGGTGRKPLGRSRPRLLKNKKSFFFKKRCLVCSYFLRFSLFCIFYMFFFSFLKVLKNSELYTHGVVAGERGCVGNARALYSSSGGNRSRVTVGITEKTRAPSMRCTGQQIQRETSNSDIWVRELDPSAARFKLSLE